MSEILAAGEPLPDCVFAVSDVMAVGALARLRAAGLAVPGDIALAGFDDIPTLRDVYPPLTTVRLPLKRMGEMAARLVLGGDAPQRPARSSRCPARSSCATAPLPRPPLTLPALRSTASGTFALNWKALASIGERGSRCALTAEYTGRAAALDDRQALGPAHDPAVTVPVTAVSPSRE